MIEKKVTNVKFLNCNVLQSQDNILIQTINKVQQSR